MKNIAVRGRTALCQVDAANLVLSKHMQDCKRQFSCPYLAIPLPTTQACATGLQKPGGRAELDQRQQLQCIAAAQARYAELSGVLSTALQSP